MKKAMIFPYAVVRVSFGMPTNCWTFFTASRARTWIREVAGARDTDDDIIFYGPEPGEYFYLLENYEVAGTKARQDFDQSDRI